MPFFGAFGAAWTTPTSPSPRTPPATSSPRRTRAPSASTASSRSSWPSAAPCCPRSLLPRTRCSSWDKDPRSCRGPGPPVQTPAPPCFGMCSGGREFGAMVRLISDKTIADSTDVATPWDATVYDTDGFWSAGNPSGWSSRQTLPSPKATSTDLRRNGPSARLDTRPVLRHGQGQRRVRRRRAEHRQRRRRRHTGRPLRAYRLGLDQERRRRRHLVCDRGGGVTQPTSRPSARAVTPGTTPWSRAGASIPHGRAPAAQ